jgi:hypothetical protein
MENMLRVGCGEQNEAPRGIFSELHHSRTKNL